VWRLSDNPAGHDGPLLPLHREMTTLTRSGSSSTVAPRSRRQRHGRKRLEKHGQGCAAGSATVSMGRRGYSHEPMTWRDVMIVAATAGITVAVRIVIENLIF
jgi:hypothetical protein